MPATTKKTTKKTPAKRARKASSRKARAAAGKAGSEAGKPREYVLPAEALEDAGDINKLRRLRMEKVEALIGEVRELQMETNETARAALVRLAKRALDLEVREGEVIGLSKDGTKLMVMSEGEAKQRKQEGPPSGP